MALIIRNSGPRWANAVIPFEDDPSLNADPPLKNAVTLARQAWEAATPIRFVPHVDQPDFIVFKREVGAPRCAGAIGRVGGAQEITLNTALSVGAIVHEIGHAVGFYHEHQRKDRDTFMAVSAVTLENQPQHFARIDAELMATYYDLLSVMHYPWSTGGSQQPLTKITPYGPYAWPNPNQPSVADAEAVAWMYGIVPERSPIVVGGSYPGIAVFVIGAGGVAKGADFQNGIWNTWYQISGQNFPARGWLAASSGCLFGIAIDGQLHAYDIERAAYQDPWITIGAPAIPGLPAGTPPLPPGAPLAARSPSSYQTQIWIVASDGQVHGIGGIGFTAAGSNWGDWYRLPGAQFRPGAPLAAHMRNDDHKEIWGIDESATLRGNWWNGEWRGWYSLPTPTGGANGFRLQPGGHVVALGRYEDHMEVWSVGTDRKLHGIWWDGDWREWYTLDGPSFPPGAPLIAVSRNDDYMEVWAVSDAGKLQGIWWNGSWRPWYIVDPLPVAPGSPVAAWSRNDDHMEVWCVAPGGAPPKDVGVHGAWWDGQWHPFYRVT